MLALNTFPVILEYCGGTDTDRLYERLSSDNPGYRINVLDNASPVNRSRYVTHRNMHNSFIGGGIQDCLSLAQKSGCKYVFIFVNDIKLVTGIDIGYCEKILEADDSIVQLGISITANSSGKHYWWTVNQDGKQERVVRHCDVIACILRVDFVASFGGFPHSKSAWGYDWELAYQAKLRQKKILISDKFICEHTKATEKSRIAFPGGLDKEAELEKVYLERYGKNGIPDPRTWNFEEMIYRGA